jgi:3-methyladenine DNA glycosylase AlkD
MKKEIQKEIRANADIAKAKTLQNFFKTAKGQYGYGDRFLGITVPVLRQIAKKYIDMSLEDTTRLLKSSYHEERLVALLILMKKFRKSNNQDKEKIFKIYLRNTAYINNWDLVDISAEHIVGAYLEGREKNILFDLAKSNSLWERRISILSTFGYIKKKDYSLTLALAETLMEDDHDLIHKAVGWMLREIGKRCSVDVLRGFLKDKYKKMPRTMLRYAIERFEETERVKYLKSQI